MRTQETRELPASLERVRRRFQQWRQTRKPRSRIPDSLWAAAVKVAGIYGLHRTARALPVEYYSLKKRMEQQPADHGRPLFDGTRTTPVRRKHASTAGTTFLELPVDHGQPLVDGARALALGVCDCTLELEDRAGSKMRVHWKAATPPDLSAFCRNFWNPAS